MVPDKAPTTKDLEQLFSKHPHLKQKLKSIYDATQDLGPHSEFEKGGRARSDRVWSEEKGFNRGLALLSKELESNDVAGDDIKAFAAYIERLSQC